MGDLRQEYRFLSGQLVEAGYRAVSMDVRGHGETSIGWGDYSVAGVGADMVGLIRHLDAGRPSSSRVDGGGRGDMGSRRGAGARQGSGAYWAVRAREGMPCSSCCFE